MQGQNLETRRMFGVAGQNEPALSGDDVLGHVEAETTKITEGTGLAAMILSLDGVGRSLR